MQPIAAQFYTGLVAEAYAPLRSHAAPAEPYARFVRRFGGPALELGCGHGEPLLDLVAAGLDVAGLDSSADMLALCRDDADRRGLRVELVCQAMEQMDLGRRFRSIYLAGPTFQLVVDPTDALHALQRIASHLTPDGRVMVPLFVPQATEPATFGVWREHVTAAGATLAVSVTGESYRADERRVDTTLRYRRGPADRPTEVVERVWSLRWYGGGEFEAMAAVADLAVERVLDHGPFGRTFILRASSAPTVTGAHRDATASPNA